MAHPRDEGEISPCSAWERPSLCSTTRPGYRTRGRALQPRASVRACPACPVEPPPRDATQSQPGMEVSWRRLGAAGHAPKMMPRRGRSVTVEGPHFGHHTIGCQQSLRKRDHDYHSACLDVSRRREELGVSQQQQRQRKTRPRLVAESVEPGLHLRHAVHERSDHPGQLNPRHHHRGQYSWQGRQDLPQRGVSHPEGTTTLMATAAPTQAEARRRGDAR